MEFNTVYWPLGTRVGSQDPWTFIVCKFCKVCTFSPKLRLLGPQFWGYALPPVTQARITQTFVGGRLQRFREAPKKNKIRLIQHLYLNTNTNTTTPSSKVLRCCPTFRTSGMMLFSKYLSNEGIAHIFELSQGQVRNLRNLCSFLCLIHHRNSSSQTSGFAHLHTHEGPGRGTTPHPPGSGCPPLRKILTLFINFKILKKFKIQSSQTCLPFHFWAL